MHKVFFQYTLDLLHTMSSRESSEEPNIPTPPCKRAKNQAQWKKYIAKRKRDSGEAYVSVKTKREVLGRSIGSPCGCVKKCFEKVGSDHIKDIFC